MSSRFIMPFADVGSGIKPSSGAKLYFYEVDGVTPKDTYINGSGCDCEVLNQNPVVANASGVFGDIYITGQYKVTLTDKNNTQIWGGVEVEEVATGQSKVVTVSNYPTLLDAAEDATAVAGGAANIAERTTGDGGGAMWDYVLASSVTVNGYNIVACTGVPTLALVLRESNGEVHLIQYGITDGGTEQQVIIQAAVDLSAAGSKIIFPDKEMILEVDIPAGQSGRPHAVNFNKPLTVIGSRKCVTKVKDFCSAWLSYTELMCAYHVTSSDVIVDGVAVDANADNHYEEDGGFKYWETGPLNKRPPSGIEIYGATGAETISNSEIKNCYVYRPLLGVVAHGSVPDTEGDDFILRKYDSLENSGLITNCHLHNNFIERARGNSCQLSGGVTRSSMYDNETLNSYYHGVRMYFAVLDSVAYNNKVNHDSRALSLLYNETDLGYYRTTDTGDVQYKMQRSGIKIGSSFVDTLGTGGNLRDCSAFDNVISYATTANNGIVETTTSYSGLHMEDVSTHISMHDNEVHNHPSYGLTILKLSGATSDVMGVDASNNQFFNVDVCAVIQTDNATVSGNKFYSRHTAGSLLTITGDTNKILDNEFILPAFNSQNAIGINSGDNNYCDGNVGINVRMSLTGAGIHYGSNALGQALSFAGSWVNAVGSIYDNPLKMYTSGNTIRISGTINGPSGTGSQFSSLPDTRFRPQYTAIIQAVVVVAGANSVVGEVYFGRVSTTGLITLDKRGNTDIGDVSFSIEYQSTLNYYLT